MLRSIHSYHPDYALAQCSCKRPGKPQVHTSFAEAADSAISADTGDISCWSINAHGRVRRCARIGRFHTFISDIYSQRTHNIRFAQSQDLSLVDEEKELLKTVWEVVNAASYHSLTVYSFQCKGKGLALGDKYFYQCCS